MTFYTEPPRPGPSLQVVKEQAVTAMSTPAAAFEAVATFEPVPTDRVWHVHRVTLTMPGAGEECQAFLCVDELRAEAVVDGTEQGAFDVSEAIAPYVVSGGKRLLVVWTGPELFPGLIGSARLDVRVLSVGSAA